MTNAGMPQARTKERKWQSYWTMTSFLPDIIPAEEWSKDKILDYMLSGIRDKTACENRRLIYENDQIIISHSILDGPAGRNAVMLVRLVKSGRLIRAETGSTPLPAK